MLTLYYNVILMNYVIFLKQKVNEVYCHCCFANDNIKKAHGLTSYDIMTEIYFYRT